MLKCRQKARIQTQCPLFMYKGRENGMCVTWPSIELFKQSIIILIRGQKHPKIVWQQTFFYTSNDFLWLKGRNFTVIVHQNAIKQHYTICLLNMLYMVHNTHEHRASKQLQKCPIIICFLHILFAHCHTTQQNGLNDQHTRHQFILLASIKWHIIIAIHIIFHFLFIWSPSSISLRAYSYHLVPYIQSKGPRADKNYKVQADQISIMRNKAATTRISSSSSSSLL